MNCDESKKLIKQGRAQEAAQHISQCEDCAAFAEDFSEMAALFPFEEEAGQPVVENEVLLKKTIALARAELRAELKSENAHTEVSRARRAAAVVFAAVCAPIILFANYYIASAGREMVVEWGAPLAGDIFFVSFAMLVSLMGFIAYGSLPILMAGAGRVLRAEGSAGRIAV